MEVFTGRIYRISAPNMGKAYYGSTTKTVERRMSMHFILMRAWNEGRYTNNCSSFDLLMDPDVNIEELEEIVGTKAEIAARERWWMDNNPCVNIRRPGRTQEERYKGARVITCECGVSYADINGRHSRHIESRRHNDHVHARQVEYFKNKTVS